MKSPSILEADVWSYGTGAPGSIASDWSPRIERVARRPHRQTMHLTAYLRLTNSLLTAAGVLLLLSAGRSIAGALGDPLLGIMGASLLVPMAAPLVAIFVGSARRLGRRKA